jgi:hypothetical protein
MSFGVAFSWWLAKSRCEASSNLFMFFVISFVYLNVAIWLIIIITIAVKVDESLDFLLGFVEVA